MPDAVALRGRRLLVVEDEYVIAADLTASLEALGVEVADQPLPSGGAYVA